MKQGAIIRIYCNFALYTHVLNETRIKKQITKMKKNLFAKTLKTVAEKGVKIGINRKCVAVYHEIDAPEKAKKFRKF